MSVISALRLRHGQPGLACNVLALVHTGKVNSLMHRVLRVLGCNQKGESPLFMKPTTYCGKRSNFN